MLITEEVAKALEDDSRPTRLRLYSLGPGDETLLADLELTGPDGPPTLIFGTTGRPGLSGRADALATGRIDYAVWCDAADNPIQEWSGDEVLDLIGTRHLIAGITLTFTLE